MYSKEKYTVKYILKRNIQLNLFQREIYSKIYSKEKYTVKSIPKRNIQLNLFQREMYS